jgi:hypothetical protein
MGLWERSSAIPGPGARSPSSPSPEAHHVYTDLLTFCFDGPNQYDQRRPIFIDAQDPSRSLNASQFRLLVRTLIAGLKAHHVQRGDCVLVHLGNSVRSPANPLCSALLTEFYASFRFCTLLEL